MDANLKLNNKIFIDDNRIEGIEEIKENEESDENEEVKEYQNNEEQK